MKKSSVGAALAVLCFHTAVRAQQSAPPPPAAPSPRPRCRRLRRPRRRRHRHPRRPPPAYPYGPPPGYGTPPVPPPPVLLLLSAAPPARRLAARSRSRWAGGVGWLSPPGDPRDNDPSFDYLARVGFGVTRNWLVFVGLDGAQVSTEDQDVTVTNYLIGAQYFILRRFYVRGGLGLATFSEETRVDELQHRRPGVRGGGRGRAVPGGERRLRGGVGRGAVAVLRRQLHQEWAAFGVELLLGRPRPTSTSPPTTPVASPSPATSTTTRTTPSTAVNEVVRLTATAPWPATASRSASSASTLTLTWA